MGKSSSKTPKAPDPAATAAAQTSSNVNTGIANAWLNSPNQVSPWGNVATTQNGTHVVDGQNVPSFTQTTTLSPEQQNIYEQGVQGDTQLNQLGLDQLDRIKQSVSTPFQLSDYGAAPVADEAYRQKSYDALIARNKPQADRDLASKQQQLANQGISQGSAAYNAAMDDYNRGLNDFRLAAQGQSGNEEAQQYGLQSQSYQQQIANALLQRQQPLQEMAQFMGTSNAFQSPNAVNSPTSNIQGTDITSPIYANYNAQLQQQQQNQSTQNGLYGGIAGLAGSALGGWGSGGFGW